MVTALALEAAPARPSIAARARAPAPADARRCATPADRVSWRSSRRRATASPRCCASGPSVTRARSRGCTLDERDDDPRRLLASVRRAIVAWRAAAPGAPFVLVLDDVHVLRHARCVASSRRIARDLPRTRRWRSPARTAPPLPIARLRAQRGVTELGPRELAMTRAEAAALLQAERREVGRAEVDLLLAAHGGMAGRPLARVPLPRRPGRGTARRPLRRQRPPGGAVPARGGAPRPPAGERRRSARGPRSPTRSRRRSATRSRARQDAAPRSPPWRAQGFVVPLDRADERYRHHRLLSRGAARGAPHHGTPSRAGAAPARRAHGIAVPATSIARSSTRSAPATSPRPGRSCGSTSQPRSPQGRTSDAERWLGRFAAGRASPRIRARPHRRGLRAAAGPGRTMAAHWTAAAAAADGRDPAAAGRRGDVARRPRRRTRRPARRRPGPTPRTAAWPRALRAARAAWRSMPPARPTCAAAALEDGARAAAVSAPAIHALCLAELAVDRRRRGRLGARRRARRPRARAGRAPRPRRPCRAWRWSSPSPRWCSARRGRVDGRAERSRRGRSGCRRSSSTSRPLADAEVAHPARPRRAAPERRQPRTRAAAAARGGCSAACPARYALHDAGPPSRGPARRVHHRRRTRPTPR